jgi:hypothetical protein
LRRLHLVFLEPLTSTGESWNEFVCIIEKNDIARNFQKPSHFFIPVLFSMLAGQICSALLHLCRVKEPDSQSFANIVGVSYHSWCKMVQFVGVDGTDKAIGESMTDTGKGRRAWKRLPPGTLQTWTHFDKYRGRDWVGHGCAQLGDHGVTVLLEGTLVSMFHEKEVPHTL